MSNEKNIKNYSFLNEKTKNFLIEEGVFDESDGEIFAQKFELTSENFDNFKQACASFKGYEIEEFEGQVVKILRNYQLKNGDVRTSFIFVENKNGQNLAILY